MEKADKELRDLLRDDQTREQLDMERTPEEGPCIEMVGCYHHGFL